MKIKAGYSFGFLSVFFVISHLYSCSSDNSVKIIFDRVDGLYNGNEVNENGIKIGKVSKMELTKENKIIVSCKINRNVRIEKDAKFSLKATDFLGSKTIEVTPGNDPDKVATDYLFQGEIAPDPVEGKVGITINSITNYFSKQDSILQKIDELNSKVDKLIKAGHNSSTR